MSDEKKLTFIKDLLRSAERGRKYEGMTNSELADELLNGVWADTPLFTELSDLLMEVIDRLKGVKHEDSTLSKV